MLTPKSSKSEKSQAKAQQHRDNTNDYEYYPGLSDSSDIIKCTMSSDTGLCKLHNLVYRTLQQNNLKSSKNFLIAHIKISKKLYKYL